MQAAANIQFHLSIWRPVATDRSYLYDDRNAHGGNNFVPIDDGGLLEQIYTWDSGLNDILGTCRQPVSQQLRKTLLESFASNVHPNDRTILQFRNTVHDLLIDQNVQENTYWTDCPETIKTMGGNEINLRANLALTMLRHFYWIASIFLDIPQASVLIR